MLVLVLVLLVAAAVDWPPPPPLLPANCCRSRPCKSMVCLREGTLACRRFIFGMYVWGRVDW